MRAGQAGHITRMVLNHCSNFATNRRSREYSIDPICAPKPNGPKIGIASGPFATKQHMNRSNNAGAAASTLTASKSVGFGAFEE